MVLNLGLLWRFTLRLSDSREVAFLALLQLAADLVELRPSLPRGGRGLFVGDPFGKDDYFLLFLTRLLYRDMSITVDRAPLSQASRIPRGAYDAVFTFQHGRLPCATIPIAGTPPVRGC